MNYDLVQLEKLANGEINQMECYEGLFTKTDLKIRFKDKARFIKIKIITLDQPNYVNKLLSIFLLVPFPLILVRVGMIFCKKRFTKMGFNYNDVKKVLLSAKGLVVDVESKDALVKLRVF